LAAIGGKAEGAGADAWAPGGGDVALFSTGAGSPGSCAGFPSEDSRVSNPTGFCPKTEAPGGRQDSSFLHQSGAASTERTRPGVCNFFDNFFTENPDHEYNGSRMNEAIDSM
jgi:hypothetical protein